MGKAEPFYRMAYLERGFSWHVSGSFEDGLESLCSAARALEDGVFWCCSLVSLSCPLFRHDDVLVKL